MNVLIITDLHLTDVPAENYRWNVFKHAKEELTKNDYDQLFILGDLFDKKDKHKSELVNRLVSELISIRDMFCPITIMQGNHDYVVDKDQAFLRFLDELENITWIRNPTYFNEAEMLFLPHSRTPEDTWAPYLDIIEKPKLKFIFMHQSVIGAKVSNYHEMKEGLDASFFKNCSAKIISGDIHVPQQLGKVTYIGTQHPVSFGDDYSPRMLAIVDEKLRFIPIDTIKRPHIKKQISCVEDIFKDLRELSPKDQVKITLLLDKNQLHEWQDFKKAINEYCKDNEIDLHDLKMEKFAEEQAHSEMKEFIKSNLKSLSSKDVLLKFAKVENIDECLLEVGIDIFEGKK